MLTVRFITIFDNMINSQDGGHFSVPGCLMLLALTLSSCYPDPIFLPQCALPISLCPSGSLHNKSNTISEKKLECVANGYCLS